MTTLVFATDRKLAFELTSLARDVDDNVVVLAAGGSVEDPEEFIHRGADQVLVAESDNLEPYTAETFTDALAGAIEQVSPKLVLVAGNRSGKEIAPRAAARLGLAAVTLASEVDAENGGFSFKRSFLGGKTIATEEATTEAVVATIPPHAYPVPDADTGRSGDVTPLEADIREPLVKVVGRKEREEAEVNIEEAEVVVGVGRGFKSEDDLQLAFDLAEVVDGEVGCSRPLATDLGWLTDEHWIGLSGKEVRSKLYFAIGISGQIQHTTGIRSSDTIVAINTNKDAPIFKVSDYGIVGDLYKVVPALTDALKSELGE